MRKSGAGDGDYGFAVIDEKSLHAPGNDLPSNLLVQKMYAKILMFTNWER